MIVDYRNCDALDMIADLKANNIGIDIVLTDPPYLTEYVSHSATKVNRRKLFGDKEDAHKNLRKVFYAMEDILNEPSALFVFSSWQKLEYFKSLITDVSTLHSCIVWDKTSGGLGDLKRAFAPSYEMILYGTRGDWHLPYRYRDMVQATRVTGSSKSIHPTQKPVDMLRWLIRAIRPYNKTLNIFDPFAGSASSLAAGFLEYCNVYGCEIDEQYYKKANAWLANLTQQGGMFIDEVEQDSPTFATEDIHNDTEV